MRRETATFLNLQLLNILLYQPRTIRKGVYKLINDISSINGTAIIRIVYDDETDTKEIIKRKGDTLTVEFDAADPETSEYVGIQ